MREPAASFAYLKFKQKMWYSAMHPLIYHLNPDIPDIHATRTKLDRFTQPCLQVCINHAAPLASPPARSTLGCQPDPNKAAQLLCRWRSQRSTRCVDRHMQNGSNSLASQAPSPSADHPTQITPTESIAHHFPMPKASTNLMTLHLLDDNPHSYRNGHQQVVGRQVNQAQR